MDITPFVTSLRADLVTAAEAGGDETRAAAERLALALDPAMRMALLEALSQAAAEITRDLPAGSVEVRLRGREPELVVDVPALPALPPPPEPMAKEPEPDADEAATARITLRLPESLKIRAEELAADAGQSLNTWLVTAVRNATRDRAVNVDIDLSSLPFGEHGLLGGRTSRGKARRMTGWV